MGQVAVIIDRLEVSYCEGWDPQARATAGPVSTAMAAERDRAGEQYAVLLAVAGFIQGRDLFHQVPDRGPVLMPVLPPGCGQPVKTRRGATG